jgi:dipeptidyl aminopeptidase/acylaminoacyl peptidase
MMNLKNPSFKQMLAAHAVLACLSLPAMAAPDGATARHPVTSADFNRLQLLSDVQLAPGGGWATYLVKSSDVAKDKAHTDLWIGNTAGTEQRPLTGSGDVASPGRWSPNGEWVAFASARGDEEQKKKGAQLQLLSMKGGEAQQITDIKGGISDVAWSPDGKRMLLVVTDFDPSEDPEKVEGWTRKTKPPIVIDRYHFKQDRDAYLGALRSHLSVLDIATRKVTRLTSGLYDELGASWSPDGTRIVFFSNRAKVPDATEESSLYTMEAREGAVPQLLLTTTTDAETIPRWSPDGKWIAYASGDPVKMSAYQRMRITVVPAQGGAPRTLAGSLERAVTKTLCWSADSQHVLAIAKDDRNAYVIRAGLDGSSAQRLTPAGRFIHDVSINRADQMMVLAADPKHPPELFANEQGALRQVSHVNDAWLATLQLGATEGFSAASADGTTVNGVVTRPPSYVAGQRYPTVLLIHGGPNGQDGFRFDPMREVLSANGYVVLQANYRGSEGRGDAYQKAIFADWGNKEVKDLLGAVDWAVKTGLADPQRLGIGGWSYGAILTNYTIASDQRFKAAISGAGSSNQISMYGTDQYIIQYNNEIGAPWVQPEQWIKLSYPFFHADKIKTPTLFMGGEKDFNVPIAGSEQMYQALQTLGVPTQLVIYPGQFHAIVLPSYERDREARYVAWFDKYLKGPR